MEPATEANMWQADVGDVLRYLFDEGPESAQEGFPPVVMEDEPSMELYGLAMAGADAGSGASLFGQWPPKQLKPFNRTVTTDVSSEPAKIEQQQHATGGQPSARKGSDRGSYAGSLATINSGGHQSSRSASDPATSLEPAQSSMQAALSLPHQATLDPCVSSATLVSPTGNVNWQELPPLVIGMRGGRGARGRGRGRASASQQPAAISKPVKDKKKENSFLIRQLEQEVQTKLSLLKELEGHNSELKRKERILQVSVDTSEHNLNNLVDHQLAPNLKTLLSSFRGTYNRANAERVLAKMDKLGDSMDMTFVVFTQTWQALAMEMCDALMAESVASTETAKRDAHEHLERLNQRGMDFCMAMCAHHCHILVKAMTVNLANGEEIEPDVEYWAGVVAKLALTDEQVKDMIGAFDLFLRSCHFMTEERKALMTKLDELVAPPLPAKVDTALVLCNYSDNNHRFPILEVQNKLRANLMRCHTLHTMIFFIALRLMTSKQMAQLCMHSSPLFPNLQLLLGALKLKAQPVANPIHAATLTQFSMEYRTLINALSQGGAAL